MYGRTGPFGRKGIPTPTGKFDIPKEVDWDLWLGTAPFVISTRPIYPPPWRGWVDYGCGSLGDMGCHFIDVPFRALKLGYPVSVACSVGSVYTGFFKEVFYTDSYPPSSKDQYPVSGEGRKMPPVELIWYDGGIQTRSPGRTVVRRTIWRMGWRHVV